MTEAQWLASVDPLRMLEFLTSSPGDSAPHHVERPAGRRPSDRKLRLFACACERYSAVGRSEVPGYARQSKAVDHAEAAADGARIDTHAARRDRLLDYVVLDVDARWAAQTTVSNPNPRVVSLLPDMAALLREVVGNPFADVGLMVRDGNLYRRVSREQEPSKTFVEERWERPDWLTRQVQSLAQAAYEDLKCEACGGPHPHRGTGTIDDGALDPFRLAVLADALTDAGCTDEALLRHLRGQQYLGPGYFLTGDPPVTSPDGWFPLRGPHVHGCWALDLVLGKH